ncbi:MAG TPA: DUF167 family protein [Xanthobacteraceae bacterium]|nr:DUF167 family protein [Xanthobacteraceae bacterium]
MPGAAAAWTITADGLLVHVRATPKAGRNSIDGIETRSDGQVVLKVRVRAAPSDGEANAAIIGCLAKLLDLAPSRIRLVGGATSRQKRLKVEGDGLMLAAKFDQLITKTGHS